MAPQTWFITGCSSGFGAEFVRQLRALGHNVIASGRNAETKLGHLKGSGASILDLDVASPEDIITAKMEEAWCLYGDIDVVVNNAGYILSGAVEELTQKELEDVFKTNYHGCLNITKAVLPFLRAKGTGTLLYLSSQAAWHVDPSTSGYCATKFALEASVECLSKELAIFAPGIKVLLVEPGYFRTSVFSNVNQAAPHVDFYSEFNAGVRAAGQTIVETAPGDCTKGVTRMIELVNGTGMAAGKTVPLRVPIGSDGLKRIKAKCEEMLKICDEWEDFAKSTDVQ